MVDTRLEVLNDETAEIIKQIETEMGVKASYIDNIEILKQDVQERTKEHEEYLEKASQSIASYESLRNLHENNIVSLYAKYHQIARSLKQGNNEKAK